MCVETTGTGVDPVCADEELWLAAPIIFSVMPRVCLQARARVLRQWNTSPLSGDEISLKDLRRGLASCGLVLGTHDAGMLGRLAGLGASPGMLLVDVLASSRFDVFLISCHIWDGAPWSVHALKVGQNAPAPPRNTWHEGWPPRRSRCRGPASRPHSHPRPSHEHHESGGPGRVPL